jgi:hypothetical protein
MSRADTNTAAHDAVLALLGSLPAHCDADAALVAGVLGWPEPEVARLLDELEAAGDLERGRAAPVGPHIDEWRTGGRRNVG